jgi:endonuclease YncB( thermonuclease family)
MIEEPEPRADKSTSSTLAVTLIFMAVLIIMAWALKRNAADRNYAAAPSAGSAHRTPAGSSGGPSIPVDEQGRPRSEYQIIDRCTLEDDVANDGDTFRVLTAQGSFRFRLYWVQAVQLHGDTPETSREAMDHFLLRAEGDLRDLAVQARDFTLNTLRGVPFRIVTRWERDHAKDAYYCFAYAGETSAPGAAQHNLALLLVKNGLALIRPVNRPLPDAVSKPGDFHNDLMAAEEEAKTTLTGGWAQRR